MTEFTTRATSLEGIPELAAQLGLDAQEILREYQTDPSVLDCSDSRIPYLTYLNILNHFSRASATPHFGLMLAREQNFPVLGNVGMAVREAPNVGEAISDINRFLYLHCNGYRSLCDVQGEVAIWRFIVDLRNAPDLMVQNNLAIGIGYQLMLLLLGNHWRPNSIHFDHPTPDYPRPYRQFFKCPVFFGQEFNGIIFPRRLLESPCYGGDKDRYRAFKRRLETTERSQQNNFASRVQKALIVALEDGCLSIETVASHLKTTPRTLQRRLKQNIGRSFREIAEDARMQVAQRYLRNTELPLLQIADILGYAELASFSRAFKRHTGVAPKHWRRALAG